MFPLDLSKTTRLCDDGKHGRQSVHVIVAHRGPNKVLPHFT